MVGGINAEGGSLACIRTKENSWAVDSWEVWDIAVENAEGTVLDAQRFAADLVEYISDLVDVEINGVHVALAGSIEAVDSWEVWDIAVDNEDDLVRIVDDKIEQNAKAARSEGIIIGTLAATEVLGPQGPLMPLLQVTREFSAQEYKSAMLNEQQSSVGRCQELFPCCDRENVDMHERYPIMATSMSLTKTPPDVDKGPGTPEGRADALLLAEHLRCTVARETPTLQDRAGRALERILEMERMEKNSDCDVM